MWRWARSAVQDLGQRASYFFLGKPDTEKRFGMRYHRSSQGMTIDGMKVSLAETQPSYDKAFFFLVLRTIPNSKAGQLIYFVPVGACTEQTCFLPFSGLT
jgi:hypothetical protein